MKVLFNKSIWGKSDIFYFTILLIIFCVFLDINNYPFSFEQKNILKRIDLILGAFVPILFIPICNLARKKSYKKLLSKLQNNEFILQKIEMSRFFDFISTCVIGLSIGMFLNVFYKGEITNNIYFSSYNQELIFAVIGIFVGFYTLTIIPFNSFAITNKRIITNAKTILEYDYLKSTDESKKFFSKTFVIIFDNGKKYTISSLRVRNYEEIKTYFCKSLLGGKYAT